MKKNILITGANGMLATYLSKILESKYSIRYLTRKVNKENEYLWDIQNNYIDPNALKDIDTIIHLAGAPIAGKRWTDVRKREIISSRVDGANLILNELKKQNLSVGSFISASAVGYYGATTSDNVFDEESDNGNDFLSDVCRKWEEVAIEFKSCQLANRVAILRCGVILSSSGGALSKIALPIKFGVGSALGNGKQYMPWIYIKDLCDMFKMVIENKKISGVFNAVAPQDTTNYELTKSIGKVLKRPIIFPGIPKFVLRIMLGEMSIMLLEGSRVSSEKIINAGFDFTYSDLDLALEDLLG